MNACTDTVRTREGVCINACVLGMFTGMTSLTYASCVIEVKEYRVKCETVIVKQLMNYFLF